MPIKKSFVTALEPTEQIHCGVTEQIHCGVMTQTQVLYALQHVLQKSIHLQRRQSYM